MDKQDKLHAPRVHFGDPCTDEEIGYGVYHRTLSCRPSVSSPSFLIADGGIRTVQNKAAIPIVDRGISVGMDGGRHQEQFEEGKVELGMFILALLVREKCRMWSQA